MGRELQKKKRRSNRQPVRQPNRPKHPLNPLGNSTIAANWDKKETLAQNYRRLGLAARLRGPTGGTEKIIGSRKPVPARDPLAVKSAEAAPLAEAKVERDADGKIVRVISRSNPLHDPLNALEDDSDAEHDVSAENHEEWGGIRETGDETDVVRELMAEARNPAEKKPRYQSGGEKEWLVKLVARYGEDYQAMARDRRLNPMQQTAKDIARRVKKMNA